ncbi:MAG: biopolymer transporter ExbD [Bdellovibrionota bacterium]
MSKLTVRASRRHQEGVEDFELNIAPIIDCFTVLIAYLLLSASFISIGIFDVGVTVPSDASVSVNQDTKASLTVELSRNKDVLIRLVGSDLDEIVKIPPAVDGERDFDRMTKGVSEIRRRLASLNEVTVTADNPVQYREVVKAVESLKKSVPKVFLGNN